MLLRTSLFLLSGLTIHLSINTTRPLPIDFTLTLNFTNSFTFTSSFTYIRSEMRIKISLPALWLVIWLTFYGWVAMAESHGHEHYHLHHEAKNRMLTRRDQNKTATAITSSYNATAGIGPLLAAASTAKLAEARRIVEKAIVQASVLNGARFQNPARNQ
jgi:hypothetical protein